MFKKSLSLIVIACFFLTTLTPYPQAHADTILNLPTPGTMINLSPVYEPVIIKGLTVHKDNPFLFDFIVDVGQDNMSGAPLKKEGEKLIKYFLASLAIPDKDVWVNLSPYEKQRMVPEALGQTDMGKDLLEQDYILKQITASLIYPEKQLGKNFWDKVYTKAQQMYGTTQVPVNTFNKVWILADRAEVFEHNQTAFVVDSHLKVMLEEDYLALQKHNSNVIPDASNVIPAKAGIHTLGSQIVREIILPELEKEVNTGKNFANLRQILNSLILANWYKKNLKEALLNQVYTNQNKVKGINLNDPTVKQQIFEQYLKAYKKGVFNYIKEDVTAQGDTIPRKYFSGGFGESARVVNPAMTTDEAVLANSLPDRAMVDLNAGLLTEPFFGSKNVVTPDSKDKASLAVNQLLEISIRASQRLVESGLRGSYGEVEAILKDDGLNPVQRLDAVRALFSKFHSITGLNDFQKVVDALAPLASSDAIDSKMKALFLGAIKDGADVYARDVFIASIKESGYIYIARLSEGKGRDEVPAIEAGQVIAPDELSGSDVIAAIQEADKRGESVFAWGGKTYPIVHGIVDVIEGTNAYATLSYAETPEMLATISPSVSGAMHFSVVGQAVNKIGNLPDSYGAGIATNVGPKYVQEFYDKKVNVDGQEFSIADIELYARHPEEIRALLDFLAYTRGQYLGELKERVVLMARGREEALLKELEYLKATEIPGLEIVQIPDGTVIPALQAMIPVEMVAKLAGRPVQDILPSMFIGIAGGPEMQSKLAIAAGLQRLGAVGSARTFDNNVGKSKPDADGKRAELGNYGNRYEFSSKAKAEMRRLRADRGDAEQILDGEKLVLARDLPQDAVGIFPVLSNTATFGGIAGATSTSVNTLVIDAQEGREPNIYVRPIKFSNGGADTAMATDIDESTRAYINSPSTSKETLIEMLSQAREGAKSGNLQASQASANLVRVITEALARRGVSADAAAQRADVRADIKAAVPEIFGDQKVNGRKLNVEDEIGRFTRMFAPATRQLVSARAFFRRQVANGTAKYGWPAARIKFKDSDGNSLTFVQIVQGLIDNATGKPNPNAWRLNNEVPLNPEVLEPGMQGTGPIDSLDMLMNQINAAEDGATSWMADWEDAGNDWKDKLYQAWKNYKLVFNGTIAVGAVFEHPTKKDANGHPKQYTIRINRDKWPVFFARIPGLHLQNRQIMLDGQPVPGFIAALIINVLNNFDAQNGRLYHYIPKIETPGEALLLAQVLTALEKTIGVERGTLKIEMLNERARFTINQPIIMWTLRHWLIGTNVGRWDYINSLIEMHKDDPNAVFADPHTIGMTAAPLHAYTRLNAILMMLASLDKNHDMKNGMPLGGMSAFMSNGNPEVDARAVKAIGFDKMRERLTGLIEFRGRVYDGYRQSWVATVTPEYVQAGAKPLQESLEQLQAQVDLFTPDEKQRLIALKLLDAEGFITPYKLPSNLTVQDLFSPETFKELFSPIKGQITEVGLRYAIHMASEYMYQQQNGNNAAAIDDPLSGGRLMNDLATYEIFWHWIWTTVQHGAVITDDETTMPLLGTQLANFPEAQGKQRIAKGTVITADLIHRLIFEKQASGEAIIQKNGPGRFDPKKLPMVMNLLERQIRSKNWISYGSKVLYSILEVNDETERQQIENAIFEPTLNALILQVNARVYPRSVIEQYKEVYPEYADAAMTSEDWRALAFSKEEAAEGFEPITGIEAITSVLDKVAGARGIVVIKDPHELGYLAISVNNAKRILSDHPTATLYVPQLPVNSVATTGQVGRKPITKVYLDAAMSSDFRSALLANGVRNFEVVKSSVKEIRPKTLGSQDKLRRGAQNNILPPSIRTSEGRFKSTNRRSTDSAQTAYGGIDLNTSNGMQWKVSKDGRGVEMNVDPAMIARIRREGIDWLSPVIFKMTPVVSVWPLVGLQPPVERLAKV